MTKSATTPRSIAERADRRVHAVDHAVDVLDAIAKMGRPAGVSDLARQTGLSKATVHHLLETLESRRFVSRDEDSGRFRLSWGLYELGANVMREVDLSRAARPYLDRLAAATGESVLLGIIDEGAVLYIDHGEAPAGLQMRANAGRRSPLHATASGKVLLAFEPDPFVLTSMLASGLDRLTPQTVCDGDRFRQELATIRQVGYATCWQEREIGLSSVAMPLRDFTGAVAGSLALAAPATRLTPHSLKAHLAALLDTGMKIEARLGAPSSARQGTPTRTDRQFASSVV